mgnify:CR=1 FL=1
MINDIIAYTLSFCFGCFLITYLLKIPFHLANNHKIVSEYYIKNFMFSVPLDYILVLGYIIIGELVLRYLKLKNNLEKVLAMGLITVLLTGGFCYYFNSYKVTSSFLSRWFHTVGYKSIIYDVALLVVIYAGYLYLKKMIS